MKPARVAAGVSPASSPGVSPASSVVPDLRYTAMLDASTVSVICGRHGRPYTVA